MPTTIFSFALFLLALDPLAPPPNGPMPVLPGLHLIDNGTVHAAPGREPARLDILIEGGRIVRVAPEIEPGAARVWDASGRHVYAGFIDAFVPVDAGVVGGGVAGGSPGSHWSGLVTPQRDALAGAGLPESDAEELRKLGFAAAGIAPDAGIFRGWGAVVSTAEPFTDPALGRPPVYAARASQHLGFETSGWSSGDYPTSHMGVVALMRQSFIDAAWGRRSDGRGEGEGFNAEGTEGTEGGRSSDGGRGASASAPAFDPKGEGGVKPKSDSPSGIVLRPSGRSTAPAGRGATQRPGDGGGQRVSCLGFIDPDGLMVYDTSFELEALLADKVAREFGHERVAIVGSGTEYKRLDALAGAGWPVVVPLAFPTAPDVWSVGAADETTLEELASWEQAPANARHLAEAGLAVSITASKLPESQDFYGNLRRAIDAGLTADDALAMLTTNPAGLLGVSSGLGTVEAGKVANLVVASAPLFHGTEVEKEDRAEVLGVWIDGRHHRINDAEDTRLDGEWTVTILGVGHTAAMRVEGEKVTSIEGESETEARRVDVSDNRISFVVDGPAGGVEGGEGAFLISGALGPDGVIRGTVIAPDQSVFEWTGTRVADLAPEGDDGDDAGDGAEVAQEGAPAEPGTPTITPPGTPVGAPFANYTMTETPAQGTVLLVNATVWTQADAGIIENGWVLIEGGKIAGVGGGDAPEAADDTEVIDCEGRHITPGLIDAHSHTGLFRMGVNEAGQAVTAEVRIADSLDPGHVNWYRQLAGGVTTANLLHGSANPIGGQSLTVKNRWGSLAPGGMVFEGARPGIKFALGENVKQANRGDGNTTRYPQTRMGVEALIRDRFVKAGEYEEQWDRVIETMSPLDPTFGYQPFNGENTPRGRWLKSFQAGADRVAMTRVPRMDEIELDFLNGLFRKQGIGEFRIPAIDLELEALAEILSGERLVHCHSYRQDEILMMCRIAGDFGFKIGTFQHGLETYKVAEVVREHAIGASIFSDWWAYKVEVQDAIPYAGPINFEAGLLTSFNSDSDELARRMNAEAGKALRYARASGIGMTPHDALDFVTRNPAVQLGIIDRVGTIEVGKDADLAVWSGDPLSSMTRCVRTFVDGRELFSLEQDGAHRARMRAERTRLIGMIMARGKPDKDADDGEGDSGDDSSQEPPTPPTPPTRRWLLARETRRALAERIDHGPRPGDCGCAVERGMRGMGGMGGLGE